MKEKLATWAVDHGIEVAASWSVEQICDALIERKVPWPTDLTNEEGWQLWAAVLRSRELSVQAVQWDEIADVETSLSLEITFRLTDRREFKTRIPQALLKKQPFGAICRLLEDRLREWKSNDDVKREEKLRSLDEQFAEKVPDLMEYVIGFRAWNVSGTRIRPIGAGNDVWDGGREVRASCGAGALHRAPDHECECGLYAWNTWDALPGRSRNDAQVYGVVRAHGRMEVHRAGFRAEFMKPVLLGYDDSEDRIERAPIPEVPGMEAPTRLVRGADFARVTAIAKNLGGIPVVGFSEIAERALEFGHFLGSASSRLLPDGD